MMACIQYYPGTDTLGLVSTEWLGTPKNGDMVLYTLWPNFGGVLEERWYKYSQDHDAKLAYYDQLPEAVRLAYMLMR